MGPSAATTPRTESPARAARWLLPEAGAEVQAGQAELARALSIRLPAARVLWNRGYRDLDTARRFLRPAFEHLHDPYLLRDMDRAVERLARAVNEREAILLYGDYDVDGTSSIVMLKKALELAGVNAEFHVPHRLRDGYGMRPEVITEAAARGVRLVISVDTGIRAGAVVEHARTLGLDVIVTDHHLPEAELPPALAVLNPNRPDCGYPEKNLCGAGVAFKLVQALLPRLGWPEDKSRRVAESFLKITALATVADVVPLTGENRAIVKLGLDSFHTVRNPGLRALMAVAGFQPGDLPTAGQVAFRLAPRINAAGRMASANDVIDLFLTADASRASALAGQLNERNQERQQTERDIVAAILEECERQPVTDEDRALVFCGSGWHRGVVGIVASRLVERFHRPAFVLSEEDGEVRGSGRSVPLFHLLEALESLPVGLLTKFGGHRQAAGVTLAAERVDEFRLRFNEWAATILNPDDFRPTYEVDSVATIAELDDQAVHEVLSLAPFGSGNPAPLFAILNTEVSVPGVAWKEKHLRVAVRARSGGRQLFLKAWNKGHMAGGLAKGTGVDVAVKIAEDDYAARNGEAGWAAFLEDVRRTGE